MFKTLKAKITGVVVSIVVLSSFGLAATLLYIAGLYGDASINASLESTANGYSYAVSQWVSNNLEMVKSAREEMDQVDPLHALNQLARAGGYDSAFVGYADKRALFTDDAVPPGYDPTTRPWYRAALTANQAIITQPYLDATTKKPVVGFAAPVIKNGQLLAVVAASLSPEKVAGIVSSIRPTEASFGMLINGAGVVLSYPDAALVLKDSAVISPELERDTLISMAKTGGVKKVLINGVTKRVYAKNVAASDWMLIVALDENDATAGYIAMRQWSIAITALTALIAVVLISLSTVRVFERISAIQTAIANIGGGSADLSRRLSVNGEDEVAAIAKSFNEFAHKLESTISDVRKTSGNVELAAREISNGHHDLSARTEQAAANLEETASSVNQLTASVSQTVEMAASAKMLSHEARIRATEGTAAVGKAVKIMTNIETASEKINEIIGLIDGISFQTNILALNAAVESARAGEHGRGFAVVASEVRMLAKKSSDAAKDIRILIKASIVDVASGSASIRDAGRVIGVLESDITNVALAMDQVAYASAEQGQGISQINNAISQLDTLTQRNAALVEETTSATNLLNSQVESLRAILSSFDGDSVEITDQPYDR